MTKSRAFGRSLSKLLPIIALYSASIWTAPLAGILHISLSSVMEVAGLAMVLLMFGGFAVVFLTTDRQAFHDLLSSTRVCATA